MRDTLMRWFIGDVCLRDAFSQSDCFYHLGPPQMASLLVVIDENVIIACHAFYNDRL